MPAATAFGTNAAKLQLTPLVYPAEIMGGGTYEVYDNFTFAGPNQAVAIGPPMPLGSRIIYGLLRWAALGASTTLQVGDQFVSNRYKTIQQTNFASCEAISRFDGVDVGGTFLRTDLQGPASLDNLGLSTCAIQVLMISATAGSNPTGKADCMYCYETINIAGS